MYAQGKECIAKAMSNFLKGFRIEIVKLYPSHKCGQWQNNGGRGAHSSKLSPNV